MSPFYPHTGQLAHKKIIKKMFKKSQKCQSLGANEKKNGDISAPIFLYVLSLCQNKKEKFCASLKSMRNVSKTAHFQTTFFLLNTILKRHSLG